MKKNPGRKERRDLARRGKKREGRLRQRIYAWLKGRVGRTADVKGNLAQRLFVFLAEASAKRRKKKLARLSKLGNPAARNRVRRPKKAKYGNRGAA